jgi:murein DD-endopeptidase MepM/ murein hydrolase activator NlpD
MFRVMTLIALVVEAASCGNPLVINGYGSPMGVQGRFRARAHSGVDFDGQDGDPVLAAADGIVVSEIDAPRGIGTCVLIEHHCRSCSLQVYFTSYCHLQRSFVRPAQVVVRGQQIAALGHSGPFAGGVSHLHFSLCRFPCSAAARDGDFVGTMNPMTVTVGCFDSSRTYDASVLTYPVACPH